MLVSAILAMSGCMISPNDGQIIYSNTMELRGYTTEPNALTIVYARKWRSQHGTWFGIAYGYSSATPFVIDGVPFKYPLYEWKATVELPSWIWSSGNIANLRASTHGGGKMVDTFFYDQEGLGCLATRISQADSAHPLDTYLAGSECSGERYEITIRKP